MCCWGGFLTLPVDQHRVDRSFRGGLICSATLRDTEREKEMGTTRLLVTALKPSASGLSKEPHLHCLSWEEQTGFEGQSLL